MSLQVQFLTFFMMFSSGWSLGILFDVYRVVSRPLHASRWLISILDIVYWIAATLFVFKVLYLSNQGEVRFFIFLGLLLGIWFYFTFISVYTIIAVKFMIRVLKRIIEMMIRCFEWLVIRPILLLYKLIIILLGIFVTIAMFLLKIVVQLFYPFRVVAKWLARWARSRFSWPIWIKQMIRWVRQTVKRFF